MGPHSMHWHPSFTIDPQMPAHVHDVLLVNPLIEDSKKLPNGFMTKILRDNSSVSTSFFLKYQNNVDRTNMFDMHFN
jgi:hypothetical protein